MSEVSPQVEIVVPVRNEEHDLAPSVTRLVGYLRDAFPFTAGSRSRTTAAPTAPGAVAPLAGSGVR